MGEIVDINTRRPAQAEAQRVKRGATIVGVAVLAVGSYFIGHERGVDAERQKQMLEVPKACFSLDRMRRGPLRIDLRGNEHSLLFTVNGIAQGADVDLGTALSKDGPAFRLICGDSGNPSPTP